MGIIPNSYESIKARTGYVLYVASGTSFDESKALTMVRLLKAYHVPFTVVPDTDWAAKISCGKLKLGQPFCIAVNCVSGGVFFDFLDFCVDVKATHRTYPDNPISNV